jgi:hypothetical protein
MITPDTLPAWFWIPAAVVLWSWLIVSVIRHAAPDPHPEYSDLDKKDGLGSHLDVTG